MQQSKSIWNIIAIWSIVASLIVFSGNLGSNQVNAASYDSNAAYSYAEKYAYKVCSDGYFYEITWPPSKLGAGVPVPSGGYDCAHFVSCCIGSEPNEQGGGLDVPSRTGVEYGEPGAERLGDWLLDNVGIEASSIDEIEKGDVINYDWDGDGHWDHAAIYLGNYKIAAHSNSNWNAFWNLGGAENYRFIHITTADQNPPAASASDLSGQPQTMEPNTVYSVIAKYYDADGRDNLKYCYLRLRHPSKPLTMMWHEPGDWYDTWEGEEGKNYLTITDVSSVNISNGYQLTWKFKINDKWPPVNNAIDFGVFAEDDNDLTSGWDYDNTKASFIIAKTDLVVQNPTVTSSGPYYPGSSLSVSCVIKNQGQGTAGSSKVKYYLSTSPTGTDYYLGSDDVSSLSAGGTSSESETVTIPDIPCGKNYYVVFYADADGQVAESDENNNKSNAGTINVQCPPPELAADAGADKTICHPNNGGTHSIQIGGAPTASGGAPPYDYKWSPSTGLNNTSIANPTASPTTTTTYTVTVTDANNDTAKDSVTVFVNPELIANAGENVTIDEGDSTTIGGSPTASGGTPPYEYSWTPSTGLNNPNIANPVASPDVTTTYTVTVTDAIGCQDSDSVTVTVDESCFYVDIDCDCDVDIFDILLVAAAWGCEVGDMCYDEKCDVNDNGAIDVFDILEVATYWGEDVCETAAPSLIAIEKASSSATVRLQASTSKITVGDSFNIELFASLPSAVQAFEFQIAYSQNAYAS
nr:amidase domain-containing protein [bacterium]